MKKALTFFLTLSLLSACSKEHVEKVSSDGSLRNFEQQNISVSAPEKILDNKDNKKNEEEKFKTSFNSDEICSGSELASPIRKHEQLCKLMVCSDSSTLALDADVLLPEFLFEDFLFDTVSANNNVITQIALDCSAVVNKGAAPAFTFNVLSANQPSRVTRSMSKATVDAKFVGDGILSNLRISNKSQSDKAFGNVQFSRLARIR